MNSNYVKFLAPTGLILGAIGFSCFAQSGPGGQSDVFGGSGMLGGISGQGSLGRPGGSAKGGGGLTDPFGESAEGAGSTGMGSSPGMGGGRFLGAVGSYVGGMAARELVTWQKPVGPEPDWLIAGRKSSEAEEELRTKLFDVCKVSFSSVNLREALSVLFQTSKIQCDINEEEISSMGKPSKDMSLSMESEGRIRELLRRLLQSNGLEYIVHESCIEITSSKHAASAPSLRYYDLSYILPSNKNELELIGSIQNSILQRGGLGTISMVGPMLVASTTERSHHQIEVLLFNLSKSNSTSKEAIGPPAVSR